MTTTKAKILFCMLVILIGIPAQAWQENGQLVDTAVVVSTHTLAHTSDGNGGMIVAFSDQRVEDEYHIYAQRFNADGIRVWPEGGVPICTYSGGNQTYAALCSDNNGGAYIAWEDVTSNGVANIYGQHINPSGTISLALDGAKLNSDSADSMIRPLMTSGDDGSAYVVWNQIIGNTYSLQAMRMDQTGRLWNTQREVSSSQNSYFARATMDFTSFGATIVWAQENEANVQNIKYRSIGPDGVFVHDEAQLAPNESVTQMDPQIEADPFGGYYVTWYEYNESGFGVYLVHVVSGSSYTGNKILLCDLPGVQAWSRMTVVEDGVIVAWTDDRNSVEHIYAQKITQNLTPLWTNNGIAVNSIPCNKIVTELIPDGAGGAIVRWFDYRNSNPGSIFMQRIKNNGDLAWDSLGVPVTTLGISQAPGGMISDGDGGVIVAWRDESYSNGGFMAQRVERSGYWGYPAATIASVEDVPGDQGGKVNLAWDSSRLDNWSDADIDNYSLWRALPDVAAAYASDNWQELIESEKTSGPIIRREVQANTTYYWEYIESVEAFNLPAYSRVVSTTSDHTETNLGIHHFQVLAHGSDAGAFWISESAQGWSVDNLAPATVAGLTGVAVITTSGFDLQWQTNAESDLHHYEVYRGLSAEFVPSASSFVSAPTDTTYLDTEWDNSGWYYKVCAVDIHENLGDFATLAPDEVSGIDSYQIPVSTVLKGNYPNPFNPSTTISYELAESGPVRLDIFETSGRLICTLVNEDQGAGRQEVFWNGRDMNNRNMASGVYLYRLQTDGQAQSRRMTLVK